MSTTVSISPERNHLGAGNICGLTLQVEANGDQPSECLTFYKSNARIVNIGRKSTQSTARRAEGDPDRALFRCPVVSRKHAKITFTEYGNAYLIDLNSHHGTHILRPGDTVSRTIEPEVPTVLADGDVVTFGKSVGRDATLVQPVTVNIKLIFGVESSASSSPEAEPHFARSSSGRYGIHPSDEHSCDSDSGSDMEEASRSPSPVPIPPPAAPISNSGASGCSQGRLEILRRLLPPIHSSFLWGPLLHSGWAEDRREQTDTSLENMDTSNSDSESDSESSSPQHSTPLEPVVVGAFPGCSSSWIPPSLPDLMCSTSHDHSAEHDVDHVLPEEPFSFSSGLFAESEHSSDGSASHQATRAVSEGLSTGPEDLLVHDLPEPANPTSVKFTYMLSDLSDSCFDSIPNSPPQPSSPQATEPSAQVADIHSSHGLDLIESRLDDVHNEITMLRMARRSNEMRFDDHVGETKDRLADLNRRMFEVNARGTFASLRVNEVREDMTQLQSRIEALGSALELEKQGVSTDVNTCETALQDMRTIRDDAVEQIAKGLQVLQAAVDEVKAHASAAQAAATSASASNESAEMTATSLKRKREEETDKDIAVGEGDSVAHAAVPNASKRRKTAHIVTKVAQTATYATIGAVAAWTALAFA